MTVDVATVTSSLTALTKSATRHAHVHLNGTLFGGMKESHEHQCMEGGSEGGKEGEGGKEDGIRREGERDREGEIGRKQEREEKKEREGKPS